MVFGTGSTRVQISASKFALSPDGTQATVDVRKSTDDIGAWTTDITESAGPFDWIRLVYLAPPPTESGASSYTITLMASTADFPVAYEIGRVYLDEDSLRLIVAKGADLLGLAVLTKRADDTKLTPDVRPDRSGES